VVEEQAGDQIQSGLCRRLLRTPSFYYHRFSKPGGRRAREDHFRGGGEVGLATRAELERRRYVASTFSKKRKLTAIGQCDTPDEGPCSACAAASLVCKFSEGGEDRRRAGPARYTFTCTLLDTLLMLEL
jgi:hypothetical protein